MSGGLLNRVRNMEYCSAFKVANVCDSVVVVYDVSVLVAQQFHDLLWAPDKELAFDAFAVGILG